MSVEAPVGSTALAGFLGGGGEMGERMRAFDWAAHPLGIPERWPQALRTAIRLMLSTNHPVFVFWGLEHFCFYNDAYSGSLGPEKHPGMLGARGRTMWEEIWPIIGPQIEQVMAGRGATWHEDHLVPIIRHGALQEVYWTYSYSPIDRADGVGGVLVLCTETTERVLLQRRQQDEINSFREALAQSPTITALLEGPEHRFVFINEACEKFLGRSDVIGLTLREAMPEIEGQGFFELLDTVYATGEPYIGANMPIAFVRKPGGAPEPAIVDFLYQPMRDATGAVQGVFVQTHDVTEHTRAELALRDSEQRLSAELSRARALQEVSTVLIREETLDALYQRLLDAAREIMRSEFASIQLLHPDGRLRLLGHHGFTDHAAGFWEWVNIESASSCGVALHARKRCVVEDVTDCDFLRGSADLAAYRQTGIRAVQTTPLLTRRGEVVGMISTHWREPHAPSADDFALLDVLARQAADLIDRKQAEAQRELLVRELSHRVKNTLATVQAIAAQMFRAEEFGAGARAAFDDRLRGLARAHDILTSSNWSDASIVDIVHAAVEPHRGSSTTRRFEIAGPAVYISPRLALALSMTLHEMATNAAKYGALSAPNGRLSIGWRLADRDGEQVLHLSWREHDGPRVSPPAATGFGTRLIEYTMRSANGSVDLRYEPDGLVCAFIVPING
ncbi:MAG: HWE histidine kinase domain-containing protein [Hyphomonadaceae bacterium]